MVYPCQDGALNTDLRNLALATDWHFGALLCLLFVMEKVIRSIDAEIIVLDDNSLWEIQNIEGEAFTWLPHDPVQISGAVAWAKMTNLRTKDYLTVSARRVVTKISTPANSAK